MLDNKERSALMVDPMAKKRIQVRSSDEFRLARIALDLSMRGIASIMGVTPRAVQKWETEHAPPKPVCRIMEWMINNGFRPPQYAIRTVSGIKPGMSADQALKSLQQLGA